MDKFLCSNLALRHFSNKQHVVEHEELDGNNFEFKTYEVKVAVFADDFKEPPTVKTLRVRLSDEQYIRLLQWQIQNPKRGFNTCDFELSDVVSAIEVEVEERLFGDNEVGTYAIYLSEIREDVATILSNL